MELPAEVLRCQVDERATPDGRTVLELVEEPIWARADGTFADYCAAIDAAMAADEDWWASERPPKVLRNGRAQTSG